jgi:hypothetical protein
MVKMDDHRTPTGDLDWVGYGKAQVAAGERCVRCAAYIVEGLISALRGPQTCSDCRTIETSDDEAWHPNLLRCPTCRHLFSAEQIEFGREEATVWCHACETEFEVAVRYEISYRSPPIGGDPKDE